MWSADDVKWLQANYPALRVEEDGNIRGRLVFRMLYDEGLRYINPSPGHVSSSDGVYIADQYDVCIERDEGKLPRAQETGGRLKAVAASKGIEPADVHLFPDGSLCLANPLVMRRAVNNGMTLKIYVENFLVPYFYAQHFFERYNRWPWGDLLHGAWGIIEWLGLLDEPDLDDITETLAATAGLVGIENAKGLFARRLRWYYKCVCNSGKRFRDCHHGIAIGVRVVRMARASKRVYL